MVLDAFSSVPPICSHTKGHTFIFFFKQRFLFLIILKIEYNSAVLLGCIYLNQIH